MNTFNTLRSLTYQFVWGRQHEVAWAQMTLLYEEGGIGMHNFKRLQHSATIEKIRRLWTNSDIWATLMNNCYIPLDSLISLETGTTSPLSRNLYFTLDWTWNVAWTAATNEDTPRKGLTLQRC